MADFLGVPLPNGPVTRPLATLAVVSIPLALLVGACYGLYRGAKAASRRFRETDEEVAARLGSAYHVYPGERQ